MRTKLGLFAIFSLVILMIVPAHASVDYVTLDKEVFTTNENFKISGTVSDAERVMILASMKGPNFEKLTRTALSDHDGMFTFTSVQADDLFKSEGTYTITVFTENDRVENGTIIKIQFEDGVASMLPDFELKLKPIGNKQGKETEILTFTADVTDSKIKDVEYSLDKEPSGATINENTGVFSWTPTDTQAGGYIFDVVVKVGLLEARETITVTITDKPKAEPQPESEPEEIVCPQGQEPVNGECPDEPVVQKLQIPASFVDESKDPQSYVDRYNNEASYKKWFDDNYSEYDSIYQAVGLEDTTVEEPAEEPAEEELEFGECGPGTDLVDGYCVIVDDQNGGGCLIATAIYGSEMAPQVQFLREIRDNQLMSTSSGASFMTGFNQLYYSFSPYIADYERENPAFKELVKIGITPMLSSLSIMEYAESESQVLGYGIGVILLNLGMYIAVPAIIIFKTRKFIKI